MAGLGAYKKKAQNIKNVRARHNLLVAGIKTPLGVNKEVHASLAGQRAFAALNLPKLEITPIALNTLKSLANELFIVADEGGRTGFAYLDAMRVRLQLLLSEAADTRTVTAKTERVAAKTDTLEARLAAAEAQSIKRQKAYLSLYESLNGLIKDGDLQAEAQERLYRVLENHHATFVNLFEPDIGYATSIEAKVTKVRKMGKPR